MRSNRIRQKLRDDECFYGPNIHIDSPWLIELIGYTGFEFVLLDGEHGMVNYHLPELILAADAVGITPIVRVPLHERGSIINALEAGAGGVCIPMVNTAGEARYLVKEVKFPPLGMRGVSNVSRAGNYGTIPAEEFGAKANEETLLIVMLETVKAFENAEAIAQVPGVDLVLIGPSDFAQSIGFPGQPGHPEVEKALVEFIRKVRKHIAVGISSYLPDHPEDVIKWRSEGVQGFLVSSVHPIRRTFESLYRKLKEGE